MAMRNMVVEKRIAIVHMANVESYRISRLDDPGPVRGTYAWIEPEPTVEAIPGSVVLRLIKILPSAHWQSVKRPSLAIAPGNTWLATRIAAKLYEPSAAPARRQFGVAPWLAVMLLTQTSTEPCAFNGPDAPRRAERLKHRLTTNNLAVFFVHKSEQS
jgi:hypothetical protein